MNNICFREGTAIVKKIVTINTKGKTQPGRGRQERRETRSETWTKAWQRTLRILFKHAVLQPSKTLGRHNRNHVGEEACPAASLKVLQKSFRAQAFQESFRSPAGALQQLLCYAHLVPRPMQCSLLSMYCISARSYILTTACMPPTAVPSQPAPVPWSPSPSCLSVMQERGTLAALAPGRRASQ